MEFRTKKLDHCQACLHFLFFLPAAWTTRPTVAVILLCLCFPLLSGSAVINGRCYVGILNFTIIIYSLKESAVFRFNVWSFDVVKCSLILLTTYNTDAGFPMHPGS